MHQLAKSYTSGMGANGNSVLRTIGQDSNGEHSIEVRCDGWLQRETKVRYLCGHENNGQDLVDSSHATRVDLAYADCAGSDELFEQYTICTMLASSDENAQRGHGTGDGKVSQHII